MAKQVIKGLTMLLLVVTLAFVASVASAKGQSSNEQRANIPFGFTIGDTNLPAGEYRVGPVSGIAEVVNVRAKLNGDGAMRLTQTLTAAAPANKGKLVFHKYGDRYFLAEIWTPGHSQGRQLRMSKAERSIQRELGSVANAKQVYEMIEIAANCPQR